MAEVTIWEMVKRYGRVTAVDNISLRISDGELMVLLGPSGCGKTTTLRSIAGLEHPESGEIIIGSRRVKALPPADRDIAFVFQFYALYPHLNVFDNIAFPLRAQHVPAAEVQARVAGICRILRIENLMHRRIRQLSSGEQQRVALGRALIRRPQVLLMDEPLTNLDAKLRSEMRVELKHLHQEYRVTTIYVTHDQVEAMALGDRIAVMNKGRLQQVGAPMEVYRRPANLFVAGFIGSPAMNLLRGRASARGSADTEITAGELHFARPGVPDGEVVVGIRPESLAPAPADAAGPALDLEVDLVEPLGEQALVHGTVAGTAAHSGAEEEQAILTEATSRAPVTAVLPAADLPGPGDRVRIRVAPERIYLFSAATGEAIW